ncbi:TatD family hydrolase [Biostraticola tofi]|uniref:TatD DNase family protein n=1 Tax=Biostraticola tofi TaxID=466109 RepID=A0A4R3Z436_9GAMM|nr:TatD family hydrolase [Biostraticola tofi]TCV99073.1 TatD DNase family protein [Biostraticola tofi]
MSRLRFIDTHCHFDFPPFKDQESQSLAQATAAGVNGIIVPAVAAEYFERIMTLVDRFNGLYAALGMHPIVIEQHDEAGLALLEHYLQAGHPRLVAIGEIGLDEYRANPMSERQQDVLLSQLKLADRYDLPVILHSRRTHDRLAAVLRRQPVARTGVVHGFAGSYQQAQAFIRLGYYIGVGGTITYERAAKTRTVMARLPLDRLLLETDAPDMPLAGFQGQPNRPERAVLTFRALCGLRSETPEQLAEALYQNSLRLFRLDQVP